MDIPSSQNTHSITAGLPIRIFLVDDSSSFLNVVSNLLNVPPRLEVVGMALSGREAVNQISELQPDLVLMDVAMPYVSGLELTRYLKKRPNAPRVVLVTTYDDPGYRMAAQLVEADGFMPKADMAEDLLALIDTMFHLVGPDGSSDDRGIKS